MHTIYLWKYFSVPLIMHRPTMNIDVVNQIHFKQKGIRRHQAQTFLQILCPKGHYDQLIAFDAILDKLAGEFNTLKSKKESQNLES